MKKLLLILVISIICLSPIYAVESTDQMSLANSDKFKTRIVYMLMQTARNVKSEALNTQCHSARTLYATNVINSPESSAAAASVMIVGGVNLIGTVITNIDPNLVDSSATDAAIFSQIGTFFNALAKCDTGV